MQAIHSMPPRPTSHTSASTTSPPSSASTRRSTTPSASQMPASTTMTCSSWMAAHPVTSSHADSYISVRARMVPSLSTARVSESLKASHFSLSWFCLVTWHGHMVVLWDQNYKLIRWLCSMLVLDSALNGNGNYSCSGQLYLYIEDVIEYEYIIQFF